MPERIWKKFLRRSRFSLWNLSVPFLWLMSLVYHLGLLLDQVLTKGDEKVPIPVISVGNISVGGTGKTPVVDLLAKLMLQRGVRVGIASSGYGRASRESLMAVGAAIQQLDLTVTGDEVKLLALGLPTVQFAVDRLKSTAVKRLANSGSVDLIIVDDAFQHHRLQRDLDVVTFDATVSAINLRLLPLGVLREPLSALARADAVIITRSDTAGALADLKGRISTISPKAQLLASRFVSQELIGRDQRFPVNYLKDKKVFLFAGIGNFEALRTNLQSMSGHLDYALELADHQRYDAELLNHIRQLADQHNSDLIVTTRKDWVKLGDFDFGRTSCYLDLRTELGSGEGLLVNWICEKLQLKTETN